MTQALEFLKTVLPDQGFYCLAKPLKFTTDAGEKVSTFTHHVFDTIEQLNAAAKGYSNSKIDIFFATGSLKERKVWNEKKKKDEIRTHANISHFKSLYVDLDCGEAKSFESQGVAIEALKAFVKESGFLKPTYTLNSGNGIHCYWAFQQSLKASDWLKMAERFKAICKHFKFNADPVCISDMARVLRVPGTFNWKNPDAPKEVKILSETQAYELIEIINTIQAILDEHSITLAVKKVSAQPDGLAWPKDLNNLSFPKEYDADLIYECCQQMARVKEVGGPVGYSMRTAAASIIKVTKQEDYSVLWANDPEEDTVQSQTESMIAASVTDNPSTCERFEAMNQGGCDGCKYQGKIKSPCVLGMRALSIYDEPEAPKEPLRPFSEDEAVVEPEKPDEEEHKSRIVTVGGKDYKIYEPPHPYTHTLKETVMGFLPDADGNDKLRIVSDFMVCPIELCSNAADQDSDSIRVYIKSGKAEGKVCEFPLEIFASNDTFRKTMMSNGAILPVNEKSLTLLTYMLSYIKYLQALVKPSETYGSLGWDSDDFNYFVTPQGRFLRNGDFIPSSTSGNIKNAMSAFKVKGTLEEWRHAVDIYAQPGYEDYAFGHLIGYGSLLFPFTGHQGAIINMVGNTGSGKSTVLGSINSMFGEPRNWLTLGDTMNAKMNRLGIYKNYPITYDEITNITQEEVSQFVYAVSGGRSKLRLDQNAQEKSSSNSTWQLMMACTSNASMIDKLSSFKQDASAELLRVFEFRIQRRDELLNSEANELFGKMNENYGHAGNIFIKEMVTNTDRVKVLYKDTFLKVERVCGGTGQKERYWRAIVASCITGGIIAKKLGLHNFDMDAVFDWAIKQIGDMSILIDENVRSPQALLVDFLNSTINRTLVIGGGVDVKGKPTTMYSMVEPVDAVWCRLETDRNAMYIDRKKFRDWITKGGSDHNNIKKLLVQSRIVTDTEVNKVLTANSNKAKTGNVRCWRIDLSHPEMTGAIIIPVGQTKPLMGDQTLDKRE